MISSRYSILIIKF